MEHCYGTVVESHKRLKTLHNLPQRLAPLSVLGLCSVEILMWKLLPVVLLKVLTGLAGTLVVLLGELPVFVLTLVSPGETFLRALFVLRPAALKPAPWILFSGPRLTVVWIRNLRRRAQTRAAFISSRLSSRPSARTLIPLARHTSAVVARCSPRAEKFPSFVVPTVFAISRLMWWPETWLPTWWAIKMVPLPGLRFLTAPCPPRHNRSVLT